ncbi:long-chain-fatty-acid--CoA ligase [Nocardioides sp. J54]|uniref:long-chain-fatty-acid--CoA ligase n=1 Tax=Nocardioides sp. J54 TaxID=935866 RepID=UPI0004917983|nr:long-chain fatty acid--CoA ligase [Nocardioides sp. J54]
MVNIAAAVWSHAVTDPDRLAVRSPVAQTYGQLREASARVAGAVREAGLAPLDRVVLIAPSVPEFVPTYYGLHAAGITVITMNTMSTGHEIGYVLDDSGASLVIAWHECAEAAREATAERNLPLWELPAGRPPAGPAVARPHEHSADDTALILYTSGTTGRPKGAELTAGNLVATVEAFVPALGLTAADRVATALPLFHVFGQAVCMNSTLSTGASLSLLSPFDPAAMLRLTRDDRVSVLLGVPTMWNAMLHASDELGAEDFADLRLAGSGGASLPAEVIKAFEGRFSCTILEGYGLTETTGAGTFSDIHLPHRPGTVGLALPSLRVEVRDTEGSPVPPGEVGRVFLSGPTLMKGYWNRPEATAADLRDGWLDTGDLGHLDADGYLTIVDRAKDLIIRGGYNVYPREVEEVLYEHPDIVEVAVVGVPDRHYGEEIAAVVVRADGARVSGEDIRTWAKERLSAYKVPRLFSFVEELPRGATGKILKRAIDRDAISRGLQESTT